MVSVKVLGIVAGAIGFVISLLVLLIFTGIMVSASGPHPSWFWIAFVAFFVAPFLTSITGVIGAVLYKKKPILGIILMSIAAVTQIITLFCFISGIVFLITAIIAIRSRIKEMKEEKPREKERQQKLQGIGGWLLFFLIIFIVAVIGAPIQILRILLAPSYINFMNTITSSIDLSTIPQPSFLLKIIHTTFLTIAFIFLLLAIIAIFKKKSKSKKLAIISTWILFVASLIENLITLKLLPSTQKFYDSLGAGISLEYLRSASYILIVLSLLSGIAWAIIVTLYFIKSKRVKNTLIK